MRGRRTSLLGCACIAAVLLGACSPATGPSAAPPLPATASVPVAGSATAWTTPPAVEHTVAAGTTRRGGRVVGNADESHTMANGSPMAGMSMHGAPSRASAQTPSIVPNGSGPHVVAAPNADGCNRAYGLPSQCVPTHAPGGGPVTCSFLQTYGYLPLLVTRDPLGLLAGTGTTVRARAGKRYLVAC